MLYPTELTTRTPVEGVHYGTLYEQLSPHAHKWEDIAIGLRFTPEEIQIIKNNPANVHEGPKAYLKHVLRDWMLWAPGDARKSTDTATLEALKKAIDKAGLGRVSQKLTLPASESTSQKRKSSQTVTSPPKKAKGELTEKKSSL